MKIAMHRTLSMVFSLVISIAAGLAAGAAQEPPGTPLRPADKPATAPQTQEPAEQQAEPAATAPVVEDDEPLDPISRLFKEIRDLRDELASVRQQLAESRLQATEAQRQLDELRQFIADQQQLGNDFQQYKAIKEIAEREDRRKEAEANRQRRLAEQAERQARAQMARAEKAQHNAFSSKIAKYRKSGFSPLGLDVYASKMAYYYETKDATPTRIDYVPQLGGHYIRAYPPTSEIDYSKMTISGSVLNASDEVRNVGVAITFFDENGNQVGHETVQVNNARPDVPYPFTSKIDMALNRPFASSSTYVLYADPIGEGDDTAPAASTTTAPALPAHAPPTPAPAKPGGYQRP